MKSKFMGNSSPRAAASHPQKYKELVGEFIKNNYTQRWVGCLVADAHRTIIKGRFFSYPSDNKSPSGCLRLLYEVLPFCFIIEICSSFLFISIKYNIESNVAILKDYLTNAKFFFTLHINKNAP